LSRDKLQALLWPESDTEQARNSLKVVVYEIRKALGTEALEATDGQLRINSEMIETDVGRFEGAIRDKAWEDAVAEYSGPFLDGFHVPNGLEFEEWSRTERTRLADRYRQVLEVLAVEGESNGEFGAALEWWRRLLAEDPSNARVTIRLMEVLEAVGERAQALELAEAHAQLLVGEYGAEPDPEVSTLTERIREAPNEVPHVTTLMLQERSRETRTALIDDRPTRRRTTSLAKTIGVPAVAAAIILLIVIGRPGESLAPDVQRVVTAPLENRTGDPALDDLGVIAADWVTQGLAQTGLVQVVPTVTVLGAAHSLTERSDNTALTDLARSLAAETETGLLVSGFYFLQGDSIGFDVQITDPKTGVLLRGIDGVFGSAEAPVEGVEVLRQRTIGALATLVDPRLGTWAATVSQPPSLASYQQFTEGMDRFLAYDFDAAAEHFRASAGVDTTFTTALIWAIQSYRNLQRDDLADSLIVVLENRQERLAPWDRSVVQRLSFSRRGDRQGAYDIMRRVAGITPSPERYYSLAGYANSLNRPNEALEYMQNVDPDWGWIRDWESFWNSYATIYHRLEEYDGEQKVLEEWRARYPKPRSSYFVAETRVINELSATLTELATEALVEELRIHGYPDLADPILENAIRQARQRLANAPDETWPRFVLAQRLYQAGRLQESRVEFERLVEAADPAGPPPFWELGYLGRIAARSGDGEAAERYSERLRDIQGAPLPARRAALPFVQRALIATLLGDRQEAAKLMKVAIVNKQMSLGDPHPLYWDGDFESLRGYPPFEELVR
jgi:DNA-binding SARP family transcriptional activator